MAFSITHIDGSMEQPEVTSGFRDLLDELDRADLEHGDVAVQHESGWGLLVFPNGRVVWENVEDLEQAPRHLEGLARSEILELMRLLAAGETESVESRPWAPGYGQ